jgi:hypothetical protein
MDVISSAPGLYFSTVRPAVPSESVRTDISAFAGNARRGPVGQLFRTTDWRTYAAAFGGLDRRFALPYAVRGYFDNDGDVAWIYRLGSDVAGTERPAVYAPTWTVTALAGFVHHSFHIEASSPGTWANGTELRIHYERIGKKQGRLDIIVDAPEEPTEYLLGLDAGEFPLQVAEQSAHVRFVPQDGPVASASMGRRFDDWTLVLGGGVDPVPGPASYMAAVNALEEAVEPALLAFPDLYRDVNGPDDRRDILARAIIDAEDAHDRLVVVDAPPPAARPVGVGEIVSFADALRDATGPASRAAALYFPYIKVADPLGDTLNPLRMLPSAGHVCGVISRVDRFFGAHHTPANAELRDVVDLTQSFDLLERAALNEDGVNVLRCVPGQGQMVFGGRTLTDDVQFHFLGPRRLVHRLVRAIRRVAEPLVFDVNGPELWLALVRAITTVLLEAYRAGALRGNQPGDAFTVKCDAATNPPEAIDNGMVLCEISFAPAAPMEVIHLRVALGDQGTLEVFES